MFIPTTQNTKNVTDMRENAVKLLRDVRKFGVVYIMHRSDPKAVMLSVEEFKRMNELIEDYLDELDAQELAKEPRGVGISHEKIVKEHARRKKI